MDKLNWSQLNPLQVGRYAEYYVKMEFTQYGFDVYSAEVDNHGIDFVVKAVSGKFFEIQSKSLRPVNGQGYIFAQKEKFDIFQDNLMMAVTLFVDGQAPQLYLIPATAWQATNALLRDRPYHGKKSKPEWGINISGKNMKILEQYEFSKMIASVS